MSIKDILLIERVPDNESNDYKLMKSFNIDKDKFNNLTDKSALDLVNQAHEKAEEVETIAFPNISTGVYSFPKEKAAQIAIRTVTNFLSGNDQISKVYFVCFDLENFELYDQLLS